MSDFNADELRAALQRLSNGTSSDADRRLVQQALLAERIVIASGERSVAVGGDVINSVIITGDVTGTLVVFKGNEAAAFREVLQSITMSRRSLSMAERGELNRAYFTEVIQKYDFWRNHYTPLVATAHVRAEPKAVSTIAPREFLPRGFDALLHETTESKGDLPTETQTVHYDDVRDAIQKYGKMVLLGEPGAGKTATLWRLMYDDAVRAQRNPDVKVPIFISLGHYDGRSSILDFLRSELILSSIGDGAGQVYPAYRHIAAHLEEYLADGELTLYFDALNEIPRSGYADSLRRLETFLESNRGNRFILTCRSLDYAIGPDLTEVTLQSLEEDRQRDFLTRHLPDVAAEHLVRALRERHGSLAEIARNPYTLLMIGQVYDLKGELPSNRGQLFRAFITALLERERQAHAVPWVDAAIQIRVLSDLAFAIQREYGRGTSVPAEWAEKYVTGHVRLNGQENDYSIADLLYLAHSASLLEVSSDGSLRFMHQLLQEYFAAVALLQLRSNQSPIRVVARYDSWDEVLVLLAGLMEDATALVEQLTPIDPFLAARCAGATQTVSEKVCEALVRQLVSQLDSRFELEQLRALEAMGDLKSGLVVPYLLKALEDIAVPEATTTEWNRLDARRTTITRALSRFRYDKIGKQITPLLYDGHWLVRISAVELLGSYKSTTTIPSLVPMLDDKEASVRAATVRALRNLNDEGIIPHLLPRLTDRDWDVRMAVVHGLAGFKSDLVAPQLISLLRKRDPELRQSSAWALGVLNVETAIPDLIRLLKDSDEAVRAAASSALGAYAPAVILPKLAPLLKDKDPKLLQGTAWTLGLLKAEETVRSLILLLKDKHPEVRAAAATALRDLRAKAAIPHLILLLKDKDANVRLAAEGTLCQFDAAIIAPQLLPLLVDKEAAVRQVAVMALGDLKAKAAVPDLLPLLKDTNEQVRSAAVVALRELESKEAIPSLVAMLDEKSPLDRTSAEALGAISLDTTISELLPLLKHPDPQLRETAARALAQHRPEEAVSQLILLLKDDTQMVRQAAIRILGLLKAESAVPFILPFLNDQSPAIRSQAAEMLKASTTEEYLPLLIPYLDADDPVICSAAYEIIEAVRHRFNLPKDYPLSKAGP